MEYTLQYSGYVQRAERALREYADVCLNARSNVCEAARYSLLGGGKRVRAVLCLAASEMLNGASATAEAYAAGVEMLHCYSLIHDDLPCMDDDDFRRGRPSCHKAYGEATALLAGDALLTAAFETLAAAPGDRAGNAEAVALLSRAAGANGMIWGQELDLHFEQAAANAEELYEIHRHKTGMLINAAAQLGALSAGASGSQRAAVEQYAFAVGLVFQIVDDILDVTAAPEQLGKPVGSDAANGKTTFVTLYGVAESMRMAKALTKEACDGLQTAFGERADFLTRLAHELLARKK